MDMMKKPMRLAVVLWIVAIAIVGVGVVRSTQAVRYEEPPIVSEFSLGSLPLMRAFHRSSGIGMEFEVGTVLLLIMPLIVGTVAALVLLKREAKQSSVTK